MSARIQQHETDRNPPQWVGYHSNRMREGGIKLVGGVTEIVWA